MFKEHHQNYIIEPTRVPQRKNIFKSALKKGNSLERVRSIDRDLGQNESAKFRQNKKKNYHLFATDSDELQWTKKRSKAANLDSNKPTNQRRSLCRNVHATNNNKAVYTPSQSQERQI